MRHCFWILLFTTANTLLADSTLNKSVKYISVLPGGYRYFAENLGNYSLFEPYLGAGIMLGVQKNKMTWNVRFNYASISRKLGNARSNKDIICSDCYSGPVRYDFGEIVAGFTRDIGKLRFRFFYSGDVFYQKTRYISNLSGGLGGGGNTENNRGNNVGISGGAGIKYFITKRIFIGLESNLNIYHYNTLDNNSYVKDVSSQGYNLQFNPVRNLILGFRL